MCFFWIICLPSTDVNPLDLDRGVRYQILEEEKHSLFYLGEDQYSVNVKADTPEHGTSLLDVAEEEWKEWVGCLSYTTSKDQATGLLSDPSYNYQVVRRFNCEDYITQV